MSTDADKDKHFPFFELPRELRDHIYDYVGGVAVQPRVPGFAGYIKAINPYPKSQLLQVGKQFALEYADASQFTQAFASIELDGQVWNESKKHSWLKIDRVDDRLSSLLRKITRVNITLRHPTYVANDEDRLARFICEICNFMPRILRVHVDFSVELRQFQNDHGINRWDIDAFFANFNTTQDMLRRYTTMSQLQVTRTLHIHGHLCGGIRALQRVPRPLRRGFRTGAIRADCYRYLSQTNRITYTATLSGHRQPTNLWEKLDLTTKIAGEFDLDEVLGVIVQALEGPHVY